MKYDYDPLNTYTVAFKNYLAEANTTGFDFYLTVKQYGEAKALEMVEERIRELGGNS